MQQLNVIEKFSVFQNFPQPTLKPFYQKKNESNVRKNNIYQIFTQKKYTIEEC